MSDQAVCSPAKFSTGTRTYSQYLSFSIELQFYILYMPLILVLLVGTIQEKIEKNNDCIFVENNLIYFDVIWTKVTSLYFVTHFEL